MGKSETGGHRGALFMIEHDWEQKLAFATGIAAETDVETIRSLLGASCERVESESTGMNDEGIDFRAYLRRGSELLIDVKSREEGCSRFWHSEPLFDVNPEPELALETWSVIPDPDGGQGVVGWTLDESKKTDYTLHRFHPSDTNEVFLLPFQLLRMAFRRNLGMWRGTFGRKTSNCLHTGETIQRSRSNGSVWHSACLFIPAWCVIEAIQAEMRVTV